MNREDFPILDNNNLIYFDNGATTLKPKCVIDAINDYYTKYTANAHRGDYDNSILVDTMYENVRGKLKNFINATRLEEIIFTSGATEALNMIVFGYFKYILKRGDEVVLTKAEHASNILPWLELEEEIGIKVKYAPLDKDLKLTLENLDRVVNKNTKVISIAEITNTVGDIRDINAIGKYAKDKNIYFVVDAAQSMPHKKIDVKASNIDFLAVSAHKMLGPTGVGFLYGKYELLDKMHPLKLGGGMNLTFEEESFSLKNLPMRLEAGTQNIAGVIGFGAAIDYLENIGMEKIEQYEKNLRNYLLEKLETIENVKIYNKNSSSGIIIFNLDNVFSQDTAIYLNNYNICIRAGNHCAKILKDELGIKNTCRISLYFYNTKDECDKLIEILKKSKEIFDIIL